MGRNAEATPNYTLVLRDSRWREAPRAAPREAWAPQAPARSHYRAQQADEGRWRNRKEGARSATTTSGAAAWRTQERSGVRVPRAPDLVRLRLQIAEHAGSVRHREVTVERGGCVGALRRRILEEEGAASDTRCRLVVSGRQLDDFDDWLWVSDNVVVMCYLSQKPAVECNASPRGSEQEEELVVDAGEPPAEPIELPPMCSIGEEVMFLVRDLQESAAKAVKDKALGKDLACGLGLVCLWAGCFAWPGAFGDVGCIALGMASAVWPVVLAAKMCKLDPSERDE